VLRRIDWSTPANILEQIIRYEAVHEIRDWDDLRRRIDPVDRRCYAFFHPALIDEPLIFVEVALTESIPSAIAPLQNVDPEEAAKLAALKIDPLLLPSWFDIDTPGDLRYLQSQFNLDPSLMERMKKTLELLHRLQLGEKQNRTG